MRRASKALKKSSAIWMGEILFRTKLSRGHVRGPRALATALPGRLMHVNVIGCAIFAAVSGSSAATCATIGKIALPELMRRGYDEKMASARSPAPARSAC